MKIIINDIRHFGSYIPKMFFIDMFTTITPTNPYKEISVKLCFFFLLNIRKKLEIFMGGGGII